MPVRTRALRQFERADRLGRKTTPEDVVRVHEVVLPWPNEGGSQKYVNVE